MTDVRADDERPRVLGRRGAGGALAVLVIVLIGGTSFAWADECAAQCRARHNQCRVQTKGSPACDAQLQSCLQGCFKPAKR